MEKWRNQSLSKSIYDPIDIIISSKMQNFSNLLNQIETKRRCHGFDGAINQTDLVGSTTHVTNDNNIHTSDNNLNNTYATSNSNLANANGLYKLHQCLGTVYFFFIAKCRQSLWYVSFQFFFWNENVAQLISISQNNQRYDDEIKKEMYANRRSHNTKILRRLSPFRYS